MMMTFIYMAIIPGVANFSAVRRTVDITNPTKCISKTDACSSKTRPDNAKQTVTDVCSTNTRSSKTKLNVSGTGVLEH